MPGDPEASCKRRLARNPQEASMETLRSAGVCIIVGFALIMAACFFTGALAIDRTTRTLRSLW
jgi:hypothetical protein